MVYGVSLVRRIVVGIDVNIGDIVYDLVIFMGDFYVVIVFDVVVNIFIIGI